jgi:hypothetical protein
MKCEQFLFEASYLLEAGEDEDLVLGRNALGKDALDHVQACASCRARFHRLRNEFHSIESEAPARTSQRLHQALDLVIAERAAQLERRAAFGRMSLQTALALIILAGSIAGITYQDHPTVTTPAYLR